MEAIIARRLCSMCWNQSRNVRLLQHKVANHLAGKVGITPAAGPRARLQPGFRGFCEKPGQKAPNGMKPGQKAPNGMKPGQKAPNGMKPGQKAPNGKKSGGINVTWMGVLCALSAGAFALLYAKYLEQQKQLVMARNRTKQVGKALLGGAWELVNHDGKTQTDRDFLGQWVMMYFGFCHCPDVCPEELEKLIQVVGILHDNKNTPDMKPLFITVDPERDTKEAIKEYVKDFSDDITGFTGSSDQIEKVTRAYRVYYSPGPKDADGDYIVDHSIIMYLVNPDGEFVDYYGRDLNAIDVARGIEKHMETYKKLQKK